MSCSLGGIALDHTPLWVDRNKYADVAADVSTAIDGSEIVMISALGGHFPLTLEATRETGWLKGSTVESLRALSAINGAYYTLRLNGKDRTVRFRNEQSGGAIQMETLMLHSNPDENTWWVGTIYLICVA